MRTLEAYEFEAVNGGVAPLVAAAIWAAGGAVVAAGVAAVSHLRSDDCTTVTKTAKNGQVTATTTCT